MEKVLFWTNLGGISNHYNAFSFLDPNFKSSTLHTPILEFHLAHTFDLIGGGQSNHMHDLWCPKE
jgi:hypothetical protein